MQFMMAADEAGVPVGAFFENAALGWIVNVDNAKAFAIAVGPLEVVHERPGEVALNRRAALDGAADGANVVTRIGYAQGVAYQATFAIPFIGEGGSTFGDDQRARGILFMQPDQQVAQARWIDLPVHLGINCARNRLDRPALAAIRAGLEKYARVIIDAQKIDGSGDQFHVARLNRRRR